MGAAYIAHPGWFSGIDTHSWQHIAVVALASGNLWFAINRYGVHQFLDYLLYVVRAKGPAATESRLHYLDDLGKYVADSLCISSIPSRARQHLAFRASSMLLLYTVAEVGFLVAFWHEPDTLFPRHPCRTAIGSLLIFATGIWQNIIARRVDYYVVDFGRKKKTT